MTPTTTETLKRYMRHAAARVGEHISAEMGSHFGLIFDGWTSGPLHFVALFAVYEHRGQRRQRLIALSNMVDGQTAEAHVDYVASVLALYDKPVVAVKFLVGDNCSTNQAIATRMGVPLVGCPSHRFNLAVVNMMSEYSDLISQIQNLMILLRLPNNAAELAEYTTYRAVRSNATRWSSVFEMVDRYITIREAILKVSAVEDVVPRGSTHRRIVALHAKLTELDSVCKKLQADKRTLGDVRLLFDACLEMYPSMDTHVKAGARIVHSPHSESAVVKVGNDLPLTAAEAKALEPFIQRSEPSPAVPEDDYDFATRVLRAAKRPRRSERAQVSYVPLVGMIPPTSNVCERLFSECKFVLTPHRSSLLPANFEMLMFLKGNRELWSAATLLGIIVLIALSVYVILYSGSPGSSRPRLTLTDVIDSVVHDAPPSDSEDADGTDSLSELDTEDEQEFIREIARLKIKMLQKRKQQRKSQSPATYQDPQRWSRTNGSVDASIAQQRRQSKCASSSSTASAAPSSPSASSCGVAEEDEDEWKPMRPSVAANNQTARQSKSHTSNQAQGSGIQSMTHGQISSKTAKPRSIH